MTPETGGAIFGFTAGVGVAQAGVVGLYKPPSFLLNPPMSPHRFYWLCGTVGALTFYNLAKAIHGPAPSELSHAPTAIANAATSVHPKHQ